MDSSIQYIANRCYQHSISERCQFYRNTIDSRAASSKRELENISGVLGYANNRFNRVAFSENVGNWNGIYKPYIVDEYYFNTLGRVRAIYNGEY